MSETHSARKTFFSRIRGKDPGNDTREMSFFDHIEELRWHIIRSLLVWLAAAITIFVFIDWVYDNIILAPANPSFYTYRALCRLGWRLFGSDSLCMPPVKIDFQVNQVNGTFTSAINIALIGGIVLCFPYLCWELWRFVKPALTPKEKRYGRGSIFYVSLCFFTGAAFGYFLLAPFTFNFLASFSLGKTGMIVYRPSINDYIDSLTNLVLGCGIAFEMPVLTWVLARLGIITGKFLRDSFKYAVVIILIVAAVVTPSPDWTSQFIMALPLTLLYLISIVIADRIDRKREREAPKTWS